MPHRNLIMHDEHYEINIDAIRAQLWALALEFDVSKVPRCELNLKFFEVSAGYQD